MSNRLYVGGVAYATTDDGLKAAFEGAGQVVSARVIMDKISGRSRGFGFVEMSNEDEAQKAIEMWDGKELDGRTLKVNIAQEPTPRSNGRNFDRR